MRCANISSGEEKIVNVFRVQNAIWDRIGCRCRNIRVRHTLMIKPVREMVVKWTPTVYRVGRTGEIPAGSTKKTPQRVFFVWRFAYKLVYASATMLSTK